MLKIFKKENLFKIGLIFILLIFLFFLIAEKIDLTTADLGRHIKNGEMVLKGEFDVLKTNFYSYTNLDFPFINHHWLSGVIFYVSYKLGGFSAIHILFLILSLGAFLLFFKTAKKTAGTIISFIVSLLIIPLIAYRNEIRPEVFSYFFSGLFLFLLIRFSKNEISFKKLLILPFIQIAWINIHIYAFLGPLIILAFLIEKLFKKQKETAKKLLLLFALCLIACLISPFGFKTLLYPLDIFKNYGYRVLENQSVFFLENLNLKLSVFFLFKMVLGLLVAGFIYIFFKKRREFPLAEFILTIGISLAGLSAVRNLSLFGFLTLPILAKNTGIIFPKLKNPQISQNNDFKIGFLVFGLLIILLSLAVFPSSSTKGLGLLPENNNSAEFFKQNNVSGLIFNNYDIGGYLVFNLYPKEKVFVDNRPEAYPNSFLQDIYIPMQEKNEIWQEQDKKYEFNAIFFNYHDATPWSQTFLIQRLKDVSWAPVFVDNFSIIFLKRNNKNKEIIGKYELPKSAFQITGE